MTRNFVVPFNKPCHLGGELDRVREVLEGTHWSANGRFAKHCERLISDRLGGGRAFLTHTCTDALEAAMIIARIGPGDEVIMPSYTFVATASAAAIRGGIPVFVDIDPETLCLDLEATRRAITDRTRAICIVHYAGVGRDAVAIRALADEHGLVLIEDAAHAFGCAAGEAILGRVGHLATLSFHETKNLTSGEGGALIVNDERLVERSELVIDKGTDRSSFDRGEVGKYTWQELGSSYRASEISAAVLSLQLERCAEIDARRMAGWRRYHDALAPHEARQTLRRPIVPEDCLITGHIYYLLLPDRTARDRFIRTVADAGVHTVTHYVPLHSSAAGLRYGRTTGRMSVTDSVADRLVRLPIYHGMSEQDYVLVLNSVNNSFDDGNIT